MSDLFLRPLFTWRAAVASAHGPDSPVTRHVLLTLGLYMSDKGDSCFPATRTLSVDTNLSHRSIITHLELAERTGWIGKRERRMAGKGWRRTEYFAVIPPDVEKIIHGERAAPANGGEPPAPPNRDEPDAPASDADERGALRGERSAHRGERGSISLTRSTSRSTSRSTPAAPPPPTAQKKKGKSHLPSDFGISESVRQWAIEHGYVAYLEHHLAYFIDYARSNGKQYIDWDGAFRNCIRSDWGRVRVDLVKRGWKPAPQQVICQFIDRQGSDICGMTPARETAYYGGKPICQHHEDKLAKPNLSMEAVNAHLQNLKTIARAQS